MYIFHGTLTPSQNTWSAVQFFRKNICLGHPVAFSFHLLFAWAENLILDKYLSHHELTVAVPATNHWLLWQKVINAFFLISFSILGVYFWNSSNRPGVLHTEFLVIYKYFLYLLLISAEFLSLIYIYIYIYIYVCVCVCVCVCAHVCMYVCVCVWACHYVYKKIYIHN